MNAVLHFFGQSVADENTRLNPVRRNALCNLMKNAHVIARMNARYLTNFRHCLSNSPIKSTVAHFLSGSFTGFPVNDD